MASANQPRARLVCLVLVVLGLLGGQAVQSTIGQTEDRAGEIELAIEWVDDDGAPWPDEPPPDTDDAYIILAEPVLAETGSVKPVTASPVTATAKQAEPITKTLAKPTQPKPDRKKIHRVCRVTAYCDRGLTASGRPVGVGQCAAPANIPLGSKVYIPALKRSFVVTDRTAKRFRHSTVDIFVPSRDRCLDFGRKYLRCEFVLPDNPRG